MARKAKKTSPPTSRPTASPKRTQRAAPADPVFPESISGDDLCSLTGFTDRWHRKIAEKGYFPPPIRGKYEFVKTMQGLFDHQRELTEQSKKNLQAKQEVLLDKKIEQATFDLAVAKKEVLPLGEIADRIRTIAEQQKSALQFQLDRLATINDGLPSQAQRKNNRDCLIAVCKAMQEFATKLGASMPAKPPEPPKPATPA